MAFLVQHGSGLPCASGQFGLSSLEALVAMLVLALGVVSLLGFQRHLLAEARASLLRAQAITMIEDLSERIKSNPSRFAVLESYVLPSWDAPATAAAPACRTAICTPAQQALSDLQEWRSLLPQTIPGALARSFIADAGAQANQRELGVMLAWPDHASTSTISSASSNAPAGFVPTAGAGAATIACPAQMQCHLAYIQP